MLSGTSTRTSPGTPVTKPAVTTPSGVVITPATTTTPGSSTVSSLTSFNWQRRLGGQHRQRLVAGNRLPYGRRRQSRPFFPESIFGGAGRLHAANRYPWTMKPQPFPSTPVIPSSTSPPARQNAAGGSTITYSNIGTILEVTPRITANDYIWLKVIPDVSSFAGQQTISSGGQTFTPTYLKPATSRPRSSFPTLTRWSWAVSCRTIPTPPTPRFPFWATFPVLGLAFRSEKKSMQKDNLLIFITPTIVQNADFKAATSDFLNSRREP